ncbi:MAG: YceI family protein [Saprospiraceae bacterium]|nr:YceI family protein [Candidatus Vicinibacter affinis]MBK8642587.1 YceI family protein [Candidatus Vicinibacter affinis]MBK9642709.1 YceI family protein [Candidatus Vicinibacter affinis]
MKKLIFLFAALLILTNGFAQKYYAKNAYVKFHSDSPMEKIEAVNNTGSTVFDLASGRVEFAALINAFQFDRALMQEHFNENYMESGKFPKATFKGAIENYSALNLSKPGTYKVDVSGDMTMHGVTNKIKVPAEVKVETGGLSSETKFKIKCEDYKISIPSVVRDKIAKEIEVTVKTKYLPMPQK